MTEFGSRVFYCTRVFLLATITVCELLSAGTSQAQSGQVIVMTCQNGIGGFDLTINLAARTIEVYNHPSVASIVATRKVHPIEQINDQEIVWKDIVEDGSWGVKEVLNRYTGAIATTGLGTIAGRSDVPRLIYCQKQQKQF